MARTTATRTTPDSIMSFGDHLEELRTRVLLALVVPLPMCVAAYFVSDTLLTWILLPVRDVLHQHGLPGEMLVLGPAELLISQFKISIIAGLVVSVPWIFWQAWQFIRPGLYEHERRFVYLLLPGSLLLTVLGVTLMYFVMLPLMLHVLVGMGASMGTPDTDPRVVQALQHGAPLHVWEGNLPPDTAAAGEAWISWPAQEMYVMVPGPDGVATPVRAPRSVVSQQFQITATVNFVLLLLVAIIIAFQLPLVIMLLGWVGILSPKWLRRQRKYAILVLAIIAAIITPPDAFSMLMMLIPLYALYEFGILLMVLAPASRVLTRDAAEGRQAPRDWGSDKSTAQSEYLREPLQPEHTVRRTQKNVPTAQPPQSSADGRDRP